MRRRQLQSVRGNLFKFIAIIGNAAARTAEGKRRADDDRKTQLCLCRARLLHRMHRKRLGAGKSYLAHRLLEQVAVFRRLNRLHRRANQLDAVALQHAVFGQIQRAVQRRLPAHRRQNRVRALPGNNFLHRIPLNRLNISSVRHLRVGHNRRRIRIDENDAQPLATQRLARLRPRIIKLARLTDDNRPRANNQYRIQITTFGHGKTPKDNKNGGIFAQNANNRAKCGRKSALPVCSWPPHGIRSPCPVQ